jgi:hypothetical protein
MATSTNYGWAEPDNSSLVKNGASDIRTLGNAIDTSLWNSGYGQAGKNKIINGDFTFNQRAFTSNTTTAAYNFDRWLQQNSGGTFTVTPQSFTVGAAPVAGYEGNTYVQGITASQSAAGDYAIITQRIENVRTFAGSSVTISFYAKANTGTPKIGVEVQQNFGSGGSPSATVSTPAGAITLTTSFARYSVTVAVPSISGKTVGSTANTSYLELNLWTSSGATNATRASSIGIQNFTASIWGVQVEYGSTATPFQIATGTLATELATCQRYYVRLDAGTTNYNPITPIGGAVSTTAIALTLQPPTTMRSAPSSIEYASMSVYGGASGGFGFLSVSSLTLTRATGGMLELNATVSGATAGGFYRLQPNNAAGYVGVIAEL